MPQASAFVSYRFSLAQEYVGLLDMFERQGLAVVNRSVDAWNPLALPTPELRASLDMRIRMSTHVIVLVSHDLAKSSTCRLEIETARLYNKPIVAVYPHGTFGGPIPKVLDGALYRAIGWRANALERAIRGDYPVESRVFDISEDADRRKGVVLIGTLAAGTAVLFGVQLESEVRQLRDELRAAGIAVPEPEPKKTVELTIAGALGGAGIAALLGARRPQELLVGAGIGGALGFGAGKAADAKAALRRLGPLVEVLKLSESGSIARTTVQRSRVQRL
jgi:hypothetical protein